MRKQQTKDCLICGQIITKSVFESQVVWDTRRKFCSRACTAEAKRGRPQTVEANEKRRLWSLGRKHTPEAKAKFSGANCHLWKGGFPKCVDCGQDMAKRTATRCRPCWYIWAQDEHHPRWDGGKTTEAERIRKSQAYQEWRIQVFVRDDYTCQHCGIKGTALHADHIKPFAYFPELRLDVDNGQTLCVPCHKQTDTYLGKARRYKPVGLQMCSTL